MDTDCLCTFSFFTDENILYCGNNNLDPIAPANKICMGNLEERPSFCPMTSSLIPKINEDAFVNLTRKLNEANSRIVEFEDIKRQHLEFIKIKDKEIEDLKK